MLRWRTFIASNQVAALEMAEPIVDDLIHLESEGIEVYDAHLKQCVKLFAPVIAILCDNGRATQLLISVEVQLGDIAECVS